MAELSRNLKTNRVKAEMPGFILLSVTHLAPAGLRVAAFSKDSPFKSLLQYLLEYLPTLFIMSVTLSFIINMYFIFVQSLVHIEPMNFQMKSILLYASEMTDESGS